MVEWCGAQALAAQGLGTAVSAACKNEKIALAIAPAITTCLMLFGGFYVSKVGGWVGG